MILDRASGSKKKKSFIDQKKFSSLPKPVRTLLSNKKLFGLHQWKLQRIRCLGKDEWEMGGGMNYNLFYSLGLREICSRDVVDAEDGMLFEDGSTGIKKSDKRVTEHAHLKIRRRQFSLRVVFAMTVHKAQEGQTLDRVGIDLRHPCFAYGQLGVALSRAQRAADVLCLCNKRSIMEDGSPKNVRNPVSRRLVRAVLAWEDA